MKFLILLFAGLTLTQARSFRPNTPDTRCTKVGQFLRDGASVCSYLVCDYVQEPWISPYNGQPFLVAVKQSCPFGSAIPSTFQDGYDNPCTLANYDCHILAHPKLRFNPAARKSIFGIMPQFPKYKSMGKSTEEAKPEAPNVPESDAPMEPESPKSPAPPKVQKDQIGEEATPEVSKPSKPEVKVPEAPAAPKAPEAPEPKEEETKIPEASKTPKAPEPPKAPEAPKPPKAPEPQVQPSKTPEPTKYDQPQNPKPKVVAEEESKPQMATEEKNEPAQQIQKEDEPKVESSETVYKPDFGDQEMFPHFMSMVPHFNKAPVYPPHFFPYPIYPGFHPYFTNPYLSKEEMKKN